VDNLSQKELTEDQVDASARVADSEVKYPTPSL